MVSTTLTAIAAGQPTSSNSNYNHHHHHQSSNVTANSNSNYPKAQNQLQQQHQQQQPQLQHHSSSSTSAVTSTAISTTNTRNSYYNYNNSYTSKGIDELYSNNSTSTNVDANVDADTEANANTDTNAETNVNAEIEVERNLSRQYHHHRVPSASEVRYERGNQSVKEETKYNNTATGESEPITTKTQRNEIVTLSQALLSNSSPLNDQISLLFPKCRPKHATTSNGNSNSNGNEINEKTTSLENFQNDSREIEHCNGIVAKISPTQSQSRAYKSETFRSPSTTAQVNKNYYRSVNIITQSPPPPSTSSVSSESLSSVTPRISTNPFLCPTDDNDANKLNEEHEKSFQDDLPVPTYRTFYYHTSSSTNNSLQRSTLADGDNDHDNIKEDEDHSFEMPRKRSIYNNNSAQMMSADNQRHHQLRQQHQEQQFQQYNGNALGDNATQSIMPTNQNPFIRDNYWEPTTTTTPTSQSTSQSTSTSRHSINSPETELPSAMYGATSSSSLRRAYHQQTFNNASNNENNINRIQHQAQQQLRLMRSPIHENESMSATFDESKSNITTNLTHYTDQSQNQSQVKSRLESHTPLVNHYMQIAKSNGIGGIGGIGGGVVSGGVGNGLNNKERREREQHMHDKREQPTQNQNQTQNQQQKQQQEQRQRQQHQAAHSMTAEERFSMISNGGIVVFDDITESWQNLKVTTDTNAPRLSPITHNGILATSSTKAIQQNTMTVMDINAEGNTKSNFKFEEASSHCREHKKHPERSNVNTSIDARHGLIEYEGSPRRIGGHVGNTSDDNRMQSLNSTRASTNFNNISNSFNSNSPQQYPARPGFPQRIMSPPRENTPPASVPNYITTVKSHYQAELHTQQQQQQQQQQPQPQAVQLPVQQSPTDTNAEDTSNDVSEIGTISDLTTPEIMSAAATATSAIANHDSIHTTSVTTPTGQISTFTTATTTTPNNTATSALTIPTKSSTFDYLYEFSETRKVLEEFFKCPSNDEKPIEDSSDIDSIDIQYEFHSNFDRDDDDDPIDAEEDDDDDDDDDNNDDDNEQAAIENDINVDVDIDDEDGDDDDDLHIQNQIQNQNQTKQQQNHFYHHQQPQQSLQQQPSLQSLTRYQYTQQQQQQQSTQPKQQQQQQQQQQPKPQEQNQYVNHRRRFTGSPLMRDFDFFLDSASRSSGEQNEQQDGINHNQQQDGRNNYRYSPETTDYDSNCGDLDSLSGDMNGVSTSCSNYAKFYASSMPVLEDGLSSGHTSDTENNNNNNNNNNFNNILQRQQQQNTGITHAPIGGGISVLMDMKRVSTNNSINSMNNVTASTNDGEKFNSITSNMLHDGHQRKLESPISSTGGNGILDDQIRETSRGIGRENHLRNNQDRELLGQSPTNIGSSNKVFKNIDPDLDALYSINVFHRTDMVQMTPPPPAPAPHRKPNIITTESDHTQGITYGEIRSGTTTTSPTPTTSIASAISSTLNRNRNAAQNNNCLSLQQQQQTTQLHSTSRTYQTQQQQQQQPPPIPERNLHPHTPSPVLNSPVWLPRHLDKSANKSLLEASSGIHSKNQSADEDDIDTDLETDRLLGHQRLDDQGYYDENKSWERGKARSLLSKISPKQQQLPSTKTRNGYNALLSSTPEIPPPIPPKISSHKILDFSGGMSSPEHSDKSPLKSVDVQDCVGSPGGSNGSGGRMNGNANGNIKKEVEILSNTNGITNNGHQNTNGSNSSGSGNDSLSNVGSSHASGEKKVKKSKNKEGGAVLIEGVLFRAKYLGSTQLVCEGQPTKSTRMMQAEEAVSRIKAPDSDVQPSTEVDLFISTEKIMVLNTDLKEIMMDHALRTISYIADIGDLVVLMARRRFVPQDIDDAPKPNRTPKMICHVFESDEAQFIAQSIGQAFQVAYMEFLKANGIEDHSFVKEMDYQEVLNSQEIFGDELEIFAKKELQKEVVVPKAKGEILGVVIVESGWGSMLPTVVIANLMSSGAAARCGQLNIGDQLIAINGLSLVGLPLSTCQNYIKNTKNQTVVKFTVVPCPPVVEVKIKRPNTKYQLGFSVQNGVICSLLRGGIAERGGVRVGHRIIEINNQSVVAVPHEKIVNLLATSVGEILMKTMPTSMFRLLTGQETPIYI